MDSALEVFWSFFRKFYQTILFIYLFQAYPPGILQHSWDFSNISSISILEIVLKFLSWFLVKLISRLHSDLFKAYFFFFKKFLKEVIHVLLEHFLLDFVAGFLQKIVSAVHFRISIGIDFRISSSHFYWSYFRKFSNICSLMFYGYFPRVPPKNSIRMLSQFFPKIFLDWTHSFFRNISSKSSRESRNSPAAWPGISIVFPP